MKCFLRKPHIVEINLEKLEDKPNVIIIEKLTALDDFGIYKISEIMKYSDNDSGKIPEDLSRSIFIAMSEKLGACK